MSPVPSQTADGVLCQLDQACAYLTLSASARHNALSIAMWQKLRTLALDLAQNQAVRVIVIRGAGAHFAAGADISEFPRQRNNAAQARDYHENIISPALQALLACPQVIVAAIQGDCIGGGLEIACCADLRLASHDARFGIPIQKLGFALAPAEMALLLQTVSPACAAELLLEARLFTAPEALARGLLSRLCDDLEAALAQTLPALLSAAPLALAMHKKMLRTLPQRALTSAEIAAVYSLMDSQDYQRGMQAFLNKHSPIFQGD